MKDHDYFLDTDVAYYKDKGSIYTYSEVDLKDKSKELIINSNDMSIMSALFRNMSVLRNKLQTKVDRGKKFKGSDITYGPSGFVLISTGVGTVPIWENPTKVIESLQVKEVVDTETFILNNTTLSNSLFSNTTNATGFVSNIQFTAPGASVTLKPFTIHATGQYQVHMEVVPTKLSLSGYRASDIFVRSTAVDTNSTIIASTDRGDLILKDVSITSDGTVTTIKTSTTFSAVYAIYIFRIQLDLDIYSTTRNYKTQVFESITLANDKLNIKFTKRDCSGNILDFTLYGRQNTTVNNIVIDLYTTEFLG